MYDHYNPSSKEFTRYLRNNSTKGEIIFWNCVKAKRLGVAFNRQKPIGDYIIDFYCKELRLAIEIDGESHYTDYAREKDKIRDAYLTSLGIQVIRIESLRIFEDLSNVVEELRKRINEIRI